MDINLGGREKIDNSSDDHKPQIALSKPHPPVMSSVQVTEKKNNKGVAGFCVFCFGDHLSILSY